MNNIVEPDQAGGSYSEYLCRGCTSLVAAEDAIGMQDDGTCDRCSSCLEPADLHTVSAMSGLMCVRCEQQPTEARVALHFGSGRCLCTDCHVTWRFEQATSGDDETMEKYAEGQPIYDEHDQTDSGG